MRVEDKIREIIMVVRHTPNHEVVVDIATEQIVEIIEKDKALLVHALTAIANSDETDLGEYAKFCEETALEVIK